MMRQLPWALLATTLTLASTSASRPIHAEGALLTPQNFQSTISNGVWFVEHFSPYCHHCREFAPTWQRLIDDVSKVIDPGIHLAQVDCAVNGDLCDEHSVTGYPQLNMYRDGVLLEWYKGRRDYDLLMEYISRYQPTRVSTLESSPMTIPVLPTTTPALHDQTSSTKSNPSGRVTVLDQSNFQNVVSQGPVFVKFYAPWCGHCKKLAPTWTQLAKHMQHKLNIAEVNCDENSALCQDQDVLGYPMLQYYSGGVKTEYTGGRKIDQLKAFTEKAAAPGVQDLVVGELESHVEKNDVVYLLLRPSSDDHILDQVTQSSQILLGSPPIYTSTSIMLFSRFAVPATSSWVLLALKDHDATHPACRFYGPIPPSAPNALNDPLTSWLLQNRLPTSVELTQDTFQSVMNAKHRPLVVIAAVNKGSKEKVAERMKEIGKVWNVRRMQKQADSEGGREVVFAWMDADKWAKWLKTMYGMEVVSAEEPGIVVADHGRLLYYDQTQSGQVIKLTSTSIFSVVDGALAGTLTAKHSENRIERMARYLHDKMTLIEHYVRYHAIRVVLGLGLLLVLAFLAFKRLAKHDDHDGVRKSDRLD